MPMTFLRPAGSPHTDIALHHGPVDGLDAAKKSHSPNKSITSMGFKPGTWERGNVGNFL